jgi:hypothetical protein
MGRCKRAAVGSVTLGIRAVLSQAGVMPTKVKLADKLADVIELNSQTLTALGATSIDDCAATAGFHTHAKAVSTLTAGNGRLVGTFHDKWPNKEQKRFRIILESPPFHQKNRT